MLQWPAFRNTEDRGMWQMRPRRRQLRTPDSEEHDRKDGPVSPTDKLQRKRKRWRRNLQIKNKNTNKKNLGGKAITVDRPP